MTKRMLEPQRIGGGNARGTEDVERGPRLREQTVGGKTQHLKPPCDHILIMHMEDITRSNHGPPPDT